MTHDGPTSVHELVAPLARRPRPRALRRRARRRRCCGSRSSAPTARRSTSTPSADGHPHRSPVRSTSTTRSRAATPSRSRAPGLERPLRTPAHFRRAVGQHGRGPHYIRASRASAGSQGTLTAADDDAVTVDIRERRRSDRAGSPTPTSSGPAPSSSGARRQAAARARSQAQRSRSQQLRRRLRDEHWQHRHDGGAQAPRRREGDLGRHPAPGPRRRAGPAYKRMPGAADEAEVRSTPTPSTSGCSPTTSTRTANLGQPERDDTPDDFGRIAAQTARQVMTPAHPRGRARAQVRGVRRPRGRHRHRHHPAERQPLHAARPGQGRGAAAPGRAGALRAARARHPPEGVHRRGAPHGQGPADRRVPHPPGPHQAAVRARGARDRRRRRRDQGLRPRARAPHEDRGLVQRPQRRPGRRLRRRPRRARSAWS